MSCNRHIPHYDANSSKKIRLLIIFKPIETEKFISNLEELVISWAACGDHGVTACGAALETVLQDKCFLINEIFSGQHKTLTLILCSKVSDR